MRENLYLVEEVLHQLGYSDIIVMAVHQQHLLQVLKFWNCIVTVAGCLSSLLTHDAYKTMNRLVFGGQSRQDSQVKKQTDSFVHHTGHYNTLAMVLMINQCGW